MKTETGTGHNTSNENSSYPRRRFLGISLSAAGALPLLPMASWAADDATAGSAPAATARKVKLGVVGCGGRGGWIANLFKQHGGYEMWGVADYFQEVADRCGDGLGVDKKRRFSGLSGYRKLIESGVEAIALETPPYCFPEHARAAVEAGLHVYMAKPVAVDVPGTLSIRDSAATAGAKKRVFLVDYQMPTDPQNIKVVEMVRKGALGKVVGVNSHYYSGLFPDPPHTNTIESRLQGLIWCNDVALGGGYHNNACIHAIEAALWLAGSRAVSATGFSKTGRRDPHGDSHDFFHLVFELENGMTLSHRGKHLNNMGPFEVVCTAMGDQGIGTIVYGGQAIAKGPEDASSGDVPNLYEAGAVRNIAKFHQYILEGNTTNDTVASAVDSALATILGREAGLRRTTITMKDLLKENKHLAPDLRGLRA